MFQSLQASPRCPRSRELKRVLPQQGVLDRPGFASPQCALSDKGGVQVEPALQGRLGGEDFLVLAEGLAVPGAHFRLRGVVVPRQS